MIDIRAVELQEEMLAALKAELEAARRLTSSERTTTLNGGLRLRQEGTSFIYQFNEMSGFPPDEGAQISMTVGTVMGKGRYLGEVNDSFAVLVDKDFGNSIEQGSITSDPLFLIEQQIELLTKESSFKSSVALASLGLAVSPQVSPLTLSADFVSGLNPFQADALRVVATNPVTYIWGPPGTGKTVTMGSLVAALANLGQKVLLVSNTNLAVDTALEQCLNRFTATTTLTDGVMLRLGEMVKSELIEGYGDRIELGRVVEAASALLRQQLNLTSQQLQVVQDNLADLLKSQAEYQAHLSTCALPQTALERLSSLKSKFNGFKDEIPRIQAEIESLESELSDINSRSRLSRAVRRRRRPEVVQADILDTQRRKSSVDKLAIELVPTMATLEREIEELTRRSRASKDWLEQHPEAKEISASIDDLTEKETGLKQQITALQEEITDTRSRILREARVVACTAYKPLSDPDIAKMSFDCVVVDEASMMTLPLYFCSAALASSRVVIAGDFRQLRPIVRMNRPKDTDDSPRATNQRRYHELLISNPFTKSGVISRFGIGVATTELIALRDQYRMRKEISDLVSTFFYPEHTLRAAGNRPATSTPWGDSPFIFFDTASLKPESSSVNGKSQRNVIHAFAVEAIAHRLIEDGWELSATAERSFGIVSPYAKQVQLIERLLSHGTGQRIGTGVSTVHRFQGNERDLMIIDLTRVASDEDSKLGSFIGHPDPMDPANSMWNVAISRARHHVIVVADSETLALNRTSVIAKLIEAMGPDLMTVDASSLLLRQPDPSSEGGIEARGSLAWFTGAGFYEAFEHDLSLAKSKVVIASPFTARNATERWLPALEDLSARQVDLTILTKPLQEKANQDDSARIHERLEGVANELRFVEKMHEKLAVIDGRVSWLGSLNILSHHSASEIMMRVDSTDFAQGLLKEYERSTAGPKGGAYSNDPNADAQVGSPCPVVGCPGTLRLVPGGTSRNSGRRYEPFIGCTHFRSHPS